jgi:hypothetical protein
MRPAVVMENHIVHENPRALFPDGSSQTCECATIEVPPSTHTAIVAMRNLVSQLARTEKVLHRRKRGLLHFIGQMSHSFVGILH